MMRMTDGHGGREEPRPAKRTVSVGYGEFHIDVTEPLDARVWRGLPSPEFTWRRARYVPYVPPPAPLFGRGSQIADARQAISGSKPIEFVGPCGSGKSTLLRYIAAELGDEVPKPAVYLIAHRDSAADLLQRITRAVDPIQRPVKATPSECTRLLSRIRPLVVLDDVAWDAQQTEYLLRCLSCCDLVLASDRPRLGRHGRTRVLPGLSDDAALVLLEHDLGRGPDRGRAASGQAVVTCAGHLLARAHGNARQAATAKSEFAKVLADRTRILGEVHPDTLTTSYELAWWRGMAGDPKGAVTLCRQIWAARTLVLGPDHPRHAPDAQQHGPGGKGRQASHYRLRRSAFRRSPGNPTAPANQPPATLPPD